MRRRSRRSRRAARRCTASCSARTPARAATGLLAVEHGAELDVLAGRRRERQVGGSLSPTCSSRPIAGAAAARAASNSDDHREPPCVSARYDRSRSRRDSHSSESRRLAPLGAALLETASRFGRAATVGSRDRPRRRRLRPPPCASRPSSEPHDQRHSHDDAERSRRQRPRDGAARGLSSGCSGAVGRSCGRLVGKAVGEVRIADGQGAERRACATRTAAVVRPATAQSAAGSVHDGIGVALTRGTTSHHMSR